MAKETRYCEICNSPFVVERWYKKYTCSAACSTEKRNITNITKHGSIENYNRATTAKREATNLLKYGTPCNLSTQETKAKIKETNLRKYGVEYPAQNESVLEKREITTVKRYGVKSYSQTDEFVQKSKQTSINKFGVENVFKDREKIESSYLKKLGVNHPMLKQDIKDKVRQTNISKYGSEYYQQAHISPESEAVLSKRESLESLYIDNNMHILDIANMLGVSVTYVLNKLHYHQIPVHRKHTSIFEAEVTEYIQSIYDGEVIINTRSVISKELDIYIPDLNLAIECNGAYWHSEVSGSRSRDYHLRKTEECNKKDIHLLHLWDFTWDKKKDIVKSRLKSLFGKNKKIYARNCQIVEVDSKVAASFMDKNHIQGHAPASIRIGLLYNGQLVYMQTFGKARYNKNIEYELLRAATILNHNIVGGLSKVLKYFIKTYNPGSLISYSDKSWNKGNSYLSAGFLRKEPSGPAAMYTKDYVNFENRLKYQKHKLEKILPVFDNNKSEWENMKENGYDRVWDCGNDVFVLHA